jgi:predicted acetyltransferase
MQSEQEAFVFLGTREAEIFEKYGFVDIVKPQDPFPETLGRIVDVKSFLRYFESEKEFVMSLHIKDEMLPENDGIFMVHCGPEGGRLNSTRISLPANCTDACERVAAEASVDVKDLIQFGFGLKKAEEAFKVAVKMREEEIFEALNKLQFKQSV